MAREWSRLKNGKPPGNPSARANVVDPYEDWEKATRPPHLVIAPSPGAGTPLPLPNWQPVFVELIDLLGEPAHQNAQELFKLEAIASNNLRLSSDAWHVLKLIVTRAFQKFSDIPLEFRRFFVFRIEAEAYLDTLADKTPLPYQVLQVGPAIPHGAIEHFDSHDTASPGAPAIPAPDGPIFLTAVIDDQIGFLNDRFQTDKNGTRVKKIWLQAMPRLGRPGLPQKGSTPDATLIDSFDRSLFEEDFYREVYRHGTSVPLGPSNTPRTGADFPGQAQVRPFGLRVGHGTQVLDLAAGYDPLENREDRPIVAVQVPSLATAETWGARLDLFILMGLIRILRWADNWKMPDGTIGRVPVVVNISYGVLAGPKDGTGFLERQIARLVGLRNKAKAPTFVVWAAGNSFRARTHARMVIGPEDSDSVTLRVQPDDLSVTFTEFWMDDVEKIHLHLTQGSDPTTVIDITKTPAIWDWKSDVTTIGRLYIRPMPKNSGRVRVVLALCPTLNHDDPVRTAPAGAYEIRIENRGLEEVRVSIDVQRDDTPAGFPRFGRQAYLDHEAVADEDPETLNRDLPRNGPINRSGTLSANATASTKGVVVVGGAFDRDARMGTEAQAAYYTSSGAGLVRGGPDLAAVSDETRASPGRLAAGFYSGSTSLCSGTSAAAPQVTRALVDWIASRGKTNGVINYQALLRGGIRLKSQDARLGNGILAYADGPGRLPRRFWRD